MFIKTKLAVLATIVCIASAGAAYAQVSTATITGVVQDAGGAIIPGAVIVVRQTLTNTTSQTVSTGSGSFSLPALPVGPYAMTITSPGFSKYERTNIVLTVGQVANFEVQLPVGAANETITVSTGTPLVNPTDPTIQDTIDEQVVVSLPLDGRNPAALVFTAGGVSNAGENIGTGQLASLSQIAPPGVTVPNSIAPAVNGVRAGGTYFSLDGAVNVDPLGVIGGPFPDPDATQEFQVVTGTFGARYVSAPGGAVNIVTHSGANQFHGTVFEFIRNSYFNANNAVLRTPDGLKRNQFGATLGGPILRNKLFFFASYQGSRQAQAIPEKYFVPTAAERSGVFQACPVGAPCTAANTTSIPLAALPPIFGPNTANSVNANFFNYKGSGNPLIPLPNSADGSYVFGLPSHNNGTQLVGRLDYQLNTKHRLFARTYVDHFVSPAVEQSTAAPYNLFNTSAATKQYWETYAVGDTWTPTPNLVFETRVSFLNVISNQDAPQSASAYDYAAFGAKNFSEPIPTGIGITVIGSTVPPSPAGRDRYPRTNFTVSEDAIYSKGPHEITIGGDFQRIHNGVANTAGQTGVVIYAGVYTSILGGILGLQFQDPAFADFYLGHPVQFIQGDGFFSSNHGSLPGVYAQDKWRVNKRLTATYGLRYDPFLPYKPENNQISCYRAGQQSTVYANAPKGLIYPGDPNCSAGGVGGYYKLVQPRVGVAYQLNQKGTQALRAGYGLYSIQVPLNALGGFQAAPFTRQLILTNPFQSISDIYGSNGATNPFSTGFRGFGYTPPANAAFSTNPPANAANFSADFRPGYVQQYSLSYQASIGANDTIELAYVGTKSTHVAQNFDLNEPVYIPGISTGVAGSCGTLSGTNLPAKGSACSSTGNEQVRRPNQGLAILSTEAPLGYSNYSGLQVSYHHRASRGLDINSNFAYQKTIDNGSNPGSTGSGVTGAIDLDATNPNFSRGLADFDQTFTFRNTLVYTAPSLKNRNAFVRTAIGGWASSGSFDLRFRPALQRHHQRCGQLLQRHQSGSCRQGRGPAALRQRKLNFNAFAVNAPGTLGNSSRNAYRSAPNYEVDSALLKTFPLTERVGLLFRAEAFNVINHANYFAPLVARDTANVNNFGTYQAARQARTLQFALKLTF